MNLTKILLFCIIPFRLLAQDGALDSTFASNGVLNLTDTAYNIGFNSIAKKNVTKIFLVGSIATKTTPSNSDILIQKFNLDGTSDNTFGTNGKVVIGSVNKNEFGRDIIILPSGKLMLGADYGDGTMLVMRLNSNGGIDSTFGSYGQVSFVISGLTLNKLAVQSNSKILVQSNTGSITRLTSTGNLDISFGSSGVLSAYDLMTLDQNDRILSAPSSSTTNNPTILRYSANGLLDSSYGNNGHTNVPASHWGPYNNYAIEIDSLNGAILAGRLGRGITTNDLRFISRYTEQGFYDTTYGILPLEPFWNSSYTQSFEKNNNILIQGNKKPIVIVYNKSAAPQSGIASTLAIGLHRYYYPPKWADVISGSNQYKTDSYFNNRYFYPPSPVLTSAFIRGDAALIGDSAFYIVITTTSGAKLYKFKTTSNAVGYPKPIANFSSAKTVGIVNSTIFSFTNTSTLNPTSYKWSFTPNTVTYSGGTNATSQNPQVIFTQPGMYDVKLVVQNIFGADSITKLQYIDIGRKPVAGFGVNTQGNNINALFMLQDTSLYSPTQWKWTITPGINTFEQGTADTSKNPVVSFSQQGYYTIKLRVTNKYSSDSVTKQNYLLVSNSKPLAKFSISETQINTDSTVQLHDESQFTPTSWNWVISPSSFQYKNGTNSTSQNPFVLFNDSVIYSIKLIVSNAAGSDSLTKQVHPVKLLAPVANFSVDKTIGDITEVFQFTDQSLYLPTSWTWSFSPNNVIYQNGTSANSQNPSVTFLAEGNYTVSLLASNSRGNNFLQKNNFINVGKKSGAEFLMSQTQGETTDIITFTDYSTNNATSWDWTISPSSFVFENGTSASSKNPDIRFTAVPSNNTYYITHTTSNIYGSSSTSQKLYIYTNNPNKPAAFFTQNRIQSYKDSVTIFQYPQNAPTVNWQWVITPNTVLFVDGTSSNTRSASVLFLDSGLYNVKLICSSLGGKDSMEKTIHVIATSAVTTPVAKFRITETQIYKDSVIQLHDESTFTPTSWQWVVTPNTVQFMNGTSSTTQSPWVSFSDSGLYTIKLICSNSAGTDSTKKTIQVIIPPNSSAPIALFDVDQTHGDTSTVFTFTDQSINNPLSRTWTYTPNTVKLVNGTDSTSKIVKVLFLQAGVYSTKLVVSNPFGVDSIEKHNLITISNSVGIENVVSQNNFNIYPNPASDIITISSGTFPIESYQVFDFTAKKVLSGIVNQNTVQIDLSILTSGSYMVMLQCNNQYTYKAVQVKK